MDMLGFLVDENVPPIIATQLRLREPNIVAVAVGQAGAPPKGTLDPKILLWLEEHHCALVTNNRASMPAHLRDHVAGGRHVPGIFVTPIPLDIGLIVEELFLVWGRVFSMNTAIKLCICHYYNYQGRGSKRVFRSIRCGKLWGT